jgi:hypothetical protein
LRSVCQPARVIEKSNTITEPAFDPKNPFGLSEDQERILRIIIDNAQSVGAIDAWLAEKARTCPEFQLNSVKKLDNWLRAITKLVRARCSSISFASLLSYS